jgi:hypothetical protein
MSRPLSVSSSRREPSSEFGVHPNTVIRDWGLARVWLKRELSPKADRPGGLSHHAG